MKVRLIQDINMLLPENKDFTKVKEV